ncbi:MAG: ornithine carbamoyltransferase [Deltaproteobacteria bacterium]|nr:MAG: ornithine carbamoyltransferase [Deltaproteobacteria bacterium]
MTPLHFLTLADHSSARLRQWLELATAIKRSPQEYARALEGKQLAMIFQKPSTRTRVSFEAGMAQLGGTALFLGAQDLQLGRGETLSDTARTLSRYVHGMMARVFEHSSIQELAKYSSVPVINGLDDKVHPCQGLADMFTMQEHFGALEGLRVAYVGDGNNVCHSLMWGAARLGLALHVATPPGYAPDPQVTSQSVEACCEGASITVSHDPKLACEGAHVIYTDSWVSMHMEKEREQRERIFAPFQVNAALMKLAAPDARFMHCLPAHRGLEVTHEVIESDASLVFTQAENRMHVQKALLLDLLSNQTS